MRLIGPAGEERAEPGVVETREFGELRSAQVVALAASFASRPRARTCSTGRRPDNRRSRRLGFRSRDRSSRGIGPFVFDRQVGNAAPRVEPVGRGKGVGRADVEAGAAGSRSDPSPAGPAEARDRSGSRRGRATSRIRARRDWCACPASRRPARGGERLFHQRRRVDEHLDVDWLGSRRGDEERRKLFQLALDDVVIIAIAGIDGDRAGDLSARAPASGSPARPIVEAEHDEALRRPA